jgi:restriction system protein
MVLIVGLIVILAGFALALRGSSPKRLSRTKRGEFFDGRIEPSLGEGAVDTTKWSLELLRKLEWRRFEEVCTGFFQAFGFRAKSTRFGADGGVDINLYAEGETSPSRLVQCKAWNAYPIGIKAIRELRGVMAERGVPRGIFVTTTTFTAEARAFAANQDIVLIDGPDLLGGIAGMPFEQQQALLELATKGDFRTPTCPSCGIKMTARRSSKDGKPFWGCVNYPRCRQTFFGKANAPA